MNEKLLKEYIERMGMATGAQLAQQTGVARETWRRPALALIEQREIFLCRFDHGRETLLSQHLLFCMRAVATGPELGIDAQELYDWLSDNELATMSEIRKCTGMKGDAYRRAFVELQQKMCAAPLMAKRTPPPATASHWDDDPYALSEDTDFLYVTDEYWMIGTHRPPRYNDLAYCLSELKRLLQNRFTTREINAFIYHGFM